MKCVPDKYLLWFHHVPWTYRMQSGRSLWDELVAHYDRGIAAVVGMKEEWDRLRPLVDKDRHAEVAARLERQQIESKWWRDASIAYWQSLSKLQLPKGHVVAATPAFVVSGHSLRHGAGFHQTRRWSSNVMRSTRRRPPMRALILIVAAPLIASFSPAAQPSANFTKETAGRVAGPAISCIPSRRRRGCG